MRLDECDEAWPALGFQLREHVEPAVAATHAEQYGGGRRSAIVGSAVTHSPRTKAATARRANATVSSQKASKPSRTCRKFPWIRMPSTPITTAMSQVAVAGGV